jgi:hypothetical protein
MAANTNSGDRGDPPPASGRQGAPANALSNLSHGSRLLRRDLVLLPCLSLLTVVVLLIAAELTARHFFFSYKYDSCVVKNQTIGLSFHPNCISHQKAAEGPWVTSQYNDCGYRTRESCGPKPKGTTRIALIGSSVSQGYLVDYDQTFSTRAANSLTGILGHRVEIQNLGRGKCLPICTFHRIDEALALKPDLLLMMISPFDVEHVDPAEIADRYNPIPPPDFIGETREPDTFKERLHQAFTESSAQAFARYLVFRNPATYVRLYMRNQELSEYVRPPFSPEFDKRLDAVELLLGEMAEKARAANVPFVLIEAPTYMQVSLLSIQTPPPGLDPYAFNRRLQQISERHGIVFIDVLSGFAHQPDPSKFFYIVDSHMNGDGDAIVARTLVEELLKYETPALSGRGPLPAQTASKN